MTTLDPSATWRRLAAVACVVLPLVFACISLSAARTKCATMDEPLHAVGAYLHVFHGDFRINPEDPPLWNYLAMLLQRRDGLAVNFNDADWAGTLRNIDHQTRVTTRTLYQTSANDGAAFVNRSRAAMVLAGVGLGWLIALWTWKLAGPVAAVVAVALFSFDPSFLAHSSLVKNDVSISFIFMAAAMAMWSVGKRISWWNVPLLALACAAAIATKYSGLLVMPIVAVALLIRAIMAKAWPVGSAELRKLPLRLAAAGGILIVCVLSGWMIVWAAYGFRFAPTADSSARFNLDFQVLCAMQNRFHQQHGRFASDDEIRIEVAPPAVRTAMFADRHRLLPHAYVFGFLYTYQTSLMRSAFLLGEVSYTGWWYYFPLTMLFKTPIATVAAMVAALVVGVWLARRAEVWSAVCLLLPLALYGAASMTTHLNLGLRHVLPVYPSLFILVGIATAAIAKQFRRATLAACCVLIVGLIIETSAAFPDYIAFFNAACKSRDIKLLGDSNLDWGQDLPALAQWTKSNPQQRLYLCYFGSVDPAFYGIRDYINLPPGFWLGPPYQLPDPRRRGVIAISATYLQDLHMPQQLRGYYPRLLGMQRPRQILGRTIYLFDFPPQTGN